MPQFSNFGRTSGIQPGYSAYSPQDDRDDQLAALGQMEYGGIAPQAAADPLAAARPQQRQASADTRSRLLGAVGGASDASNTQQRGQAQATVAPTRRRAQRVAPQQRRAAATTRRQPVRGASQRGAALAERDQYNQGFAGQSRGGQQQAGTQQAAVAPRRRTTTAQRRQNQQGSY